MIDEVLSDRALNRALLARQGLLVRTRTPALEWVERLVALQAQEPLNPYVALWSRIEGFDPEELSGALERREVVRAALLRPTIHLATSRDALTLAPLIAEVLETTFGSPFGKPLLAAGIDPREAASAGLAMLEAGPMTRAQLSAALADRWPEAPRGALAYAVTSLHALVQVPPRGLWRRSGQATWAALDDWLGEPIDDAPSVDEIALRYLAAFGPASVSDMRIWSRYTGLRPVFERLRPQLRTFRDERGRELFDVRDGALPDPSTPAPVRFLPEYDNVLLGHEDRSRMLNGLGPGLPAPTGMWIGSVLVDGFYRAFWKAEVDGDAATLRVDRFAAQPGDPPGSVDEIVAEGDALLELIAPEAARRGVELVG